MAAHAQADVRIGFLGCGRITDLESLGYREDPRARIVAVCDADAELAHRRAGEWAAERAYTNYRDLLGDDAVDAVVIATPHHVHAEHAVAALEAGKHVSLQKPPARTLEEYDRIAAAVRATDRVFRVFENFSFYPPHVRARALIDAGAIGTPLSIRLKTAAGRPSLGWEVPASALAWRARPELCGGGATTFDHGYHCFHMARWFLPAEIARVHAFIHWNDFGGGLRYDGPALVSWTYSGAPARCGSWEVVASVEMEVESRYYASDDRMEIHGSEGIVWVNRCTGRLLEEPVLVVYRDGETRAFHNLETDWAASFRAGARAFLDAIVDGQPVTLDVEEARKTLAVAIAAQRSAAERREVDVAEIERGNA